MRCALSQTEIICACIIGVILVLGFIFLVCLVSYLEYKKECEKNKQLERIANACFGIEEVLDDVRRELISLSTISADIDRIEVHQSSFFECAVKLGSLVLDEIKKVGE